MAMRIGELLLSKGVLVEGQVEEIVQMQKKGDKRKFGEIAVSRGFMADSALNRYLEFLSEHQEPEA
jgi:hypothetical protein